MGFILKWALSSGLRMAITGGLIAALLGGAVTGFLVWKQSIYNAGRTAERLLCTQEKKQSQEDAQTIDRDNDKVTQQQHLDELAAERLRTLAAQAQTEEYQNEINALPEQVRACRRATANDDKRMQRRN